MVGLTVLRFVFRAFSVKPSFLKRRGGERGCGLSDLSNLPDLLELSIGNLKSSSAFA